MDLKSVLESFSSSRLDIGCYLIYAIKNQFYLASRMNICIRIVWIPFHKGIEGNERADEHAKLG